MWASVDEEALCKSSNFSSFLKTESHFERYEGSQRVFTITRLLKQQLKGWNRYNMGEGQLKWVAQPKAWAVGLPQSKDMENIHLAPSPLWFLRASFMKSPIRLRILRFLVSSSHQACSTRPQQDSTRFISISDKLPSSCSMLVFRTHQTG